MELKLKKDEPKNEPEEKVEKEGEGEMGCNLTPLDDTPDEISNPLQIILNVLQTLITKVEGLNDIKEKEKVIGKLKGALEILSKSCN